MWAENLLVCKESRPSTSRDGGTVFYLTELLCAVYGLLKYGGWQEVTIRRLFEWDGKWPAADKESCFRAEK